MLVSALGGFVDEIANLFLQAKHWQIFLLLVAAPTVAQVAAPERINDFGTGGFILFAVIAVSLLCLLAWFGSMGLFFRSIVTPELRMGTQFFRFSLVYPLVFVPIFFFPGIPEAVIGPLQLACTVCLFYLMYFVSRSLVLAETGKPVSFYEYAGAFFLLWFFPIGVWFVQPKVNRLYAERSGTGPLTVTIA